MNMIAEEIRKLIAGAVKALDLPSVEFVVEHPKDEAMGDYSSNVAMVVFAQVSISGSAAGATRSRDQAWENPREVAEALKQQLEGMLQAAADLTPGLKDKPRGLRAIERVEVAGPGFINFRLSEEWLVETVKTIFAVGNDYGKSDRLRGKRAIVEYSSPNIAKPFTIGHLRSTIIGDAVANLLEANGWEVLRDNHLGDWGTQFGKQIYAIKVWGDEAAIASSDNPVKELVGLYVLFHDEAEKDPSLEDEARKWFKRLEDGDEEARRLWQLCTDWSWKEFERIYEQLGVTFSQEFNQGRGLGEAFFEDKMGVVLEDLKQKKMLTEGKEGAQLVFFPDEKHPPAMILKKDGATLYHTRDLATDKYRLEEYKPDLIVNEVGAEQALYFRQLFEMEAMLGWFRPEQRVHIGHGLIRFAEGKMSTRKGNVVWLQEVLEEAEKRAFYLMSGKHDIEYGETWIETKRKKNPAKTLKFSEISNLSRSVGIGALKWNDLKGSAGRDVVFDWDEMLSMSGNSGPYVQYTFARCKSVLSKSKLNTKTAKPQLKINKLELHEEELAILRCLYRFPEVVAQAGEEYAPHMVCGYVYELAGRFNSFYNKHSILGKSHSDDPGVSRPDDHRGSSTPGSDQREFRLALTAAVAQVLENGLGLLGIEAPAKM